MLDRAGILIRFTHELIQTQACLDVHAPGGFALSAFFGGPSSSATAYEASKTSGSTNPSNFQLHCDVDILLKCLFQYLEKTDKYALGFAKKVRIHFEVQYL